MKEHRLQPTRRGLGPVQGELWPDETTRPDTQAGPARDDTALRSTELISLRLPKPMLEQLKAAARRERMPYQTLLKRWLQERISNQDRRASKQ